MVPLQDCLGLGSDARMNMPGSGGANWQWRCDPLALTDSLAQKLAQLIALYGRAA
jgi:4-alpha-glucanotransferase